LVTVQMLFNLIYIGTALRILSSGISFPKRDRG
jgi:voltage-gated potassium channel